MRLEYKARRPKLLTLALTLCFSALSNSSSAEFTTVIDSPPAEFERYGQIESNTQVNLYSGGELPGRYRIGPTWESGDNIEINLLGGSIGNGQNDFGGLSTSSRWVRTTNVTVNLESGHVWGDLNATAGALVTLAEATVHGDLEIADGSLAVLSGGRIEEELSVSDGSTVQMAGGVIGRGESVFLGGARVYGGSVFLMHGGVLQGALGIGDGFANITGGRVTGQVAVVGSELEISGGSVGSLELDATGNVTLVGGDFELDGTPVGGLSANSQSIGFPEDSVLTGVLSDGTPVILSNIGPLRDSFPSNRIDLRLTPVPASDPTAFDSASDPIPLGLRQGQSLLLRSGTRALPNFTALSGTSVRIEGGEVAHGFEAVGAEVTMTSGRIGEMSTIYRGTTLSMSGGEIESNFEVASGGRLEVSGGTVGTVFIAHPQSEVLFSGGTFTGLLGAESESSFTVEGGNFRVNGVPLPALATPGSEMQIDLPELGVLSGTLRDGTPFAFSGRDARFAPGTLSLRATEVPLAEAVTISVPNNPVPNGLQSGQTLLLSDGGDIGNHFTAGWGSVVRMSGGKIGTRFQAVGSLVNVTGGEVDSLNALFGSVVNIDGGTINHHASVEKGGVLNVFNGGVEGTVYANDGGRVNIKGGNLGRYTYVSSGSLLDIEGGVVDGNIYLYEGGTLTLEGGEMRGEIHAWTGSHMNIRGGRFADRLSTASGSTATLVGSDLRLDADPIAVSFNTLTPLEIPSGSVLSGVLADGTTFAFASSDGDYISMGTLSVKSDRYVVTPAPVSVQPLPYVPGKGLRPGAELALQTGESIGDNFTAGWGSRLILAGGEVGDNFEAVGADVRLEDGVIGDDMDLFYGSSLAVVGGVIGEVLQAHRGSTVAISGGNVPRIELRTGSSAAISGGVVGSYRDSRYLPGLISLEAGSDLEILGTDFLVNGQPVEDIADGDSLLIDLENRPLASSLSLSALLADGTPFDVSISQLPLSQVSDWNYFEPSSITLKLVSASAAIPEPGGLAAILTALGLLALVSRRVA